MFGVLFFGPFNRPFSDQPLRGETKYMGYKLKSKLYSYVSWLTFDPIKNQPIISEDGSTEIVAEQLYNLSEDSGENDNLAEDQAHESIMKKMRAQLLSRIIRK